MNTKMKKWLAVAGGLLICAVLAVLIASRFSTEQPQDAPLPEPASEAGAVAVGLVGEAESTEKEEVVTVVKPEIESSQSAEGGAVSSGAAQTIQPDVSKPETAADTDEPHTAPSDPRYTDPESKPDNGAQSPQSSTPQNGDTSGGQIYVEGFGWVENHGGGGSGETIGSDGDINKPVGNM